MNSRANRFAPFLRDAASYSPTALRMDLVAGITVAVFAVPQAMAYAMLADVPPVYGLYAAAVMSIVAALWGASAHVNTGPTNSAALLTAAALLPFAARADHLTVVFAFTLVVGLLRLGMGLLRLGRLVRFVPESGFMGFTVGAGTLIALGQLHHLFKVPAPDQPVFVLRIAEVLRQAPQAHLPSLAVGLGVLVFMLGLNRYARRVPVALFAILLATAAASLAGAAGGLRLVQDVAAVPSRLPGLVLPITDYPTLVAILPGAFAVAVIGLIEAVSIGQTLALKHGRSLDFDQEFIGQGLSHVVGAFFQGIPGSGSFSRSLLVEQAGGITRFANVYFGLFTGAALFAFPALLNRIPVCALAGLLLFIGMKLVDTRGIRRVWVTSRSDAAVMGLTFFVTVFVKIEYGIFVAILAGAMLFFHRASRLRVAELLPRETGEGFDEVPYDGVTPHEPSDLVAIGITGDLFYGVAQELRDQLNAIVLDQDPKHLVLRVRRAYSIDYSCWSALFDVAAAFRERGGQLYLAGVRPDYEQIIQAAGMREVLPPECVFERVDALFTAFRRCVESAASTLPESSRLSAAWILARRGRT